MPEQKVSKEEMQKRFDTAIRILSSKYYSQTRKAEWAIYVLQGSPVEEGPK